jgi:two-component system nitrate/nitrite sensor histidine kinase NarX
VDGEDLVWVAKRGETTEPARFQRPARKKLVIEALGRSSTPDSLNICSQCDAADKDEDGHRIHAELRTGDRVFGTLCASRPNEQPFDPDEEQALKLLANSVAIAIANASLLQSERLYSAQITAMMERERLAANLHDDLAQTLSFLSLKAGELEEDIATRRTTEATRELGVMQEALRRAYAQVRAALIDLRRLDPGSGDPVARTVSANLLSEQLADALASFRDASGLNTALIVTHPEALELPAAVKTQVLYVVREALANVRRHAGAQQVLVRVECADGGERARFIIEDDGRGFDPTTVRGEHHLGLTIMRERAERSGGHLVIDSEPGAGTRLTAEFPLDVREKEGIN